MARFATGFGVHKGSLGLDVGARQIRAVLATPAKGDAGMVQSAGVVDLANYKSPVEALRVLVQKLGATGAPVHCGAGRASVLVQEVEFPLMEARDLQAAVRIEGEQLMPDIQSQVLEWQVLGKRVTADGKTVQCVLLVAAPRAMVQERAALCEAAGLQVATIVPDGIAIANLLAVLRPPESGAAVAVEVAEDSSTLVAVGPEKDSSAPIVRSISGGVDVVGPVEGAPSAAGASPSGAPSADRNWTSSKSERWLREIERSLEFATEKLKSPVQHLLVTGDGAQSPALLGFLSQSVPAAVATWNPLEEMKRSSSAPGDDFIKRHGFNCAVAIGLALQEGS